MATTLAQPGTTLKRIAKEYASQAGLSTEDYLARLRRLNPDYSAKTGSEALRLGKGVKADAGTEQTPPAEQAPAVDYNQVANILGSRYYTEPLQDYYLSTYLPGLTQATYDINAARNELVANEAARGRQRGEAIRRIAGSYAARGMRSPGAINKERSEVQSQFADLSRQERAAIQALENQRDVLYGAGAQDQETFLSNPVLFGSIGAGARRSALSGLQELPEMYNLLGLNASTAPLVNQPPAEQAAVTPAAAPKTPKAPKATTPKPAPKPLAPKPTSKKTPTKANVPASWLSGRTAR